MGRGGVGLSIRPLSPVHLSDSTDLEQDAPGTLTHLEWLEDVVLPSGLSLEMGSEDAVDLRLLAVTARGAFSPFAPWTTLMLFARSFRGGWTTVNSRHLVHIERALRTLRSVRWARVQEVGRCYWGAGMGESRPPGFCDCRTDQVRPQSMRRSATRTTEGLLSFVVPRLGVAFSSFVVGETGSPDAEGKATTRVLSLNSYDFLCCPIEAS